MIILCVLTCAGRNNCLRQTKFITVDRRANFYDRFVEYKNFREAAAAKEDYPDGMNNFHISGCRLHVQFALSLEERQMRKQKREVSV